MKYHYSEGTVRWFQWTGGDDVRCHRPPKGWEAFADMTDINPVTGRQLRTARWWIRETYVGVAA